MSKDLQIAIIGAGVMGGAIISGLLRHNTVAPAQITAADVSEERRQALRSQYHINVSNDNLKTVSRGQVVILAIKPQAVESALPSLQGLLQKDALCISVIAGTPINTLSSILNHQIIVRAMPNTPAQIGEGMTVWTSTPRVNEHQRNLARTVLRSLGHERYVEQEHELDMATAISGSGPAYVFLMIEAMIDAGVNLGFPRSVAQELVFQTMAGAVRYAQQSDTHPAQLRNAVTSPGGTTAAGLRELERGGLRTTLSEAIWAAYERAQELDRQSKEYRTRR